VRDRVVPGRQYRGDVKGTLARREAVLASITKPVTFAGLVEAMRMWTRYWFELAELPNGAVA
jgi:hypothetical protein